MANQRELVDKLNEAAGVVHKAGLRLFYARQEEKEALELYIKARMAETFAYTLVHPEDAVVCYAIPAIPDNP